MEWVKVFIELIREISWPIAIVALPWMFKNEIKSILISVARSEKMSFKLGGHEFSSEKIKDAVTDAKKEMVVDEISAQLEAFTKNVEYDKEELCRINEKIAERVVSLTGFDVSLDDIKALSIINNNPGLSTDDIFDLSRKMGEFVNAGALTGLEHDGLITGHLQTKLHKTNKVYLSEKGEKLMTALKTSHIGNT